MATNLDGSPASPTMGPQATPDEIKAYINQNMPEMSYLLDNPEVFDTIVKWAHDDAPDTDLVSRLRQTSYWKTNSPESRAWDDLKSSDPAAAQEKAFTTASMVQRTYQTAGVTISPEQAFQVADQYIRSGWTADDLNRNIASAAQTAGQETNKETLDAQQMQSQASQYGVTMPPTTANGFAAQMAAGTMDTDGFNVWLQAQAKARWANNPDVTAAIGKGVTPNDFFASARQTIATTLELNPDQVDVFNGQFASATSYVDPKTNQIRPMTTSEVRNLAMQDDRVTQTQWFKDADTSMSTNLVKMFGKAPA